MALRILVVGAGAVGGYFGARLAQAGRDVSFLVRSARTRQLAEHGLRIVSPHGDTLVVPKLLSARQIQAPYDLIFLSVKAYALEAAMTDFAAAVGPGTMILPVLNGMRHIDMLSLRFGSDAVLGGTCRISTQIDDEGRIVQLTGLQQLSYGERNGSTTARLRAVDECLRGARFDTELSTDIIQAMWEKWVQLASLGAATCLMRGAIGQIVAAPGGTETALQILDECAAVAAACGHAPSRDFLSRHTGALTTAGSALTSSMYRDLQRGAPVEADHILGDLIARGQAQALVSPLTRAAFVNLRVYQETRRT